MAKDKEYWLEIARLLELPLAGYHYNWAHFKTPNGGVAELSTTIADAILKLAEQTGQLAGPRSGATHG